MRRNSTSPFDVTYVLQDAMREGRKSKFDPYKLLKVTFVGEGAIDSGGPRREFFRLLGIMCADSAYFHGLENCKFFASNVPAVKVHAIL